MEAQVRAEDNQAPDSARLLILDYGSQYTRLIARRVREAGVYSEIHPHDMNADALQAFGASGIILSGGPESVGADDSPVVADAVIDAGVPLLGICYGMQALAAKLGGVVESANHREFGYAEVNVSVNDGLLGGVAPSGKPLKVWMSHGDRVETLPQGFEAIAASANAPLAGMANYERQVFGLQFHPEVTHTENGQRIIEQFVHGICGCPSDWTPRNIIADHIERVRTEVGSQRVLLGLSGGVDSSVVAALLHEAIGDQLICVFVDNGLLRLNEADQVMKTFHEHLGVNVIRVDAEQEFLDALGGEADPELKRKIIGRKFIEVFDREAERLEGVEWLAQGTIYPDVIESAGAGTGKAHVIKSHHNVGGLPERMKLKLVEPLRDLFKDEVRKIGRELGLPQALVGRHPFPGPGLGVRILGEVKKEYADLLRRADDIFIGELREQGLYDDVSQAFAVFLPVKSVGVMGDGRRYDYVVALRAVETIDFMTARWARLPYEFLEPNHQRGSGNLQGLLRHLNETARHDRVGVTRPGVNDTDSIYMERALSLARRAAAAGEVPVGAVLVGKDGTVLAETANAPIATSDPSAHAEMLAIRAAGAAIGNYRLVETTLYVTLEPCVMCAGAIVHARVARLVFGATDPRCGACGSVFDLTRNEALNHEVEVEGGILAEECSALLQGFFADRR